jgi:hypothetical protein
MGKKMNMTYGSHMQMRKDRKREWHGFNFVKFQWHIYEYTNCNDIYLNSHIFNGMDRINHFF